MNAFSRLLAALVLIFGSLVVASFPARAYTCTQTVSWTTSKSFPVGTGLCLTRTLEGQTSRLIFRTDGDLVWYVNGTAKWHTGTSGKGVARLVLASNANVVLYNASGGVVWALSRGYSSWTSAASSTTKSLGAFANAKGTDVYLFVGGRGYPFASLSLLTAYGASCGQNRYGYDWFMTQRFARGQFCLTDPSSNEKLVFQGDGNLVYYRNGYARWASGTVNQGTTLNFQSDGNIVIRNSAGTAVWAMTWRHSNWKTYAPKYNYGGTLYLGYLNGPPVARFERRNNLPASDTGVTYLNVETAL